MEAPHRYHITVQSIDSFKSATPPDPTTFAFLKGIDDVGNGNGLLQATVTGGLHVGIYRVCTMIAPRNHQPVNMPDAQRGAQDDCTKFGVVAAAGNAKASATAGKNAGNANTSYRQSSVRKVDEKAADQRYSM